MLDFGLARTADRPPPSSERLADRESPTIGTLGTLGHNGVPPAPDPLGESHLRLAVREFIAHYHGERNHQGLDNSLLVAGPSAANTGPVRCLRRLGGTLNFYYREAA